MIFSWEVILSVNGRGRWSTTIYLFTEHLCKCYMVKWCRVIVLKPPMMKLFSQELKQMYYVDLNAVITTGTNFLILQITSTCESEPESLWK